MTPEGTEKAVKKHLEKVWKARKSPNKMTVTMGHGGRPWVSDTNHPNYEAAKRATKTVWGVDPDLTREGKPF